MYFGGDYYPEQWDEDVWESDVALMNEAHVNLVSLGVFAWSKLQPAEDRYEFDWLDRIIELLHKGGISINLGTATASPPQWATRNYPEILPEDENGATYWPGSRQHYSPTSPDYRRLAGDLVTRLAARYAGHPAVVMWHVNNEYGCHVAYDYSDNAAKAFRLWLRERYGSVQKLNESWGTSFWSQEYRGFEEVLPPRKTPTSHNPAAMLDFRRFSSDALLELFRMEKKIIRAAGAVQPVTTNFMGAFEPLNYRKWATEVDIIADDSYPDPADPESFRIAAFTRDLMRSLKPGTPWILMEQAPNAVNWRTNNAVKAPGQMAAFSMQAVARGAGGIMFFQWRQSTAGSEKFHSAMLPHAGTSTRTWSEIVQLGANLGQLRAAKSLGDAQVAIILDWENWWALDQPNHPATVDYLEVIKSWYLAFHRASIQVDVVGPDDDLGNYQMVVAPCLYLLTATGAGRLSAFVERGGHLVAGPYTDVVDQSDQFRPGGFTVQLRHVLGLQVVEFAGIDGADARTEFELAGERYACRTVAEEVRTTGAQAWARYATGPFTGDPAITVNNFGAGRAYYFSTLPSAACLDTALTHLVNEAGVSLTMDGLPDGVEAIRAGRAVTLINHSAQPATVFLPPGLTDISGSAIRLERCRMQPYEFRTVYEP